MEIFYTPEDVEKEYGIQTKTLANWRANLIGPQRQLHLPISDNYTYPFR